MDRRKRNFSIVHLFDLFAPSIEIGRPHIGKDAEQKSRIMHRTVSPAQPEFAKYIILIWNGREQALVFPFNVKHEDVLEYIRAEQPEVQAVSAGLYCNEPDGFWSGGRSGSLNLKSRPKDRRLLQRFFSAANRRSWDMTRMAKEAEAVAKASRKGGGAAQSSGKGQERHPREIL